MNGYNMSSPEMKNKLPLLTSLRKRRSYEKKEREVLMHQDRI